MNDVSRTLVGVYEDLPTACGLLYRLLQERSPAINISHRRLPSWEEHVCFVESRPYEAWYLIQSDGNPVGAVYLTFSSEIGVFVLAEYRGRGHGSWAIRTVMHKHPRDRYLANINPLNSQSLALFERLGFRLIQNTLELLSSNGGSSDRS